MAIGFLLYAFQGWGIFAEAEFSLSITPDDVKCRARNLHNEGILPSGVRVSYDEGLTFLMAAVLYNDHSSVSAFLANGDDARVALKRSVKLGYKKNVESDEILVRPQATPRKKRVFDLKELRLDLLSLQLPELSRREAFFPPTKINDEKPLCTVREKKHRRKAHQTKSSGTPTHRLSKDSKAQRTRSLPNKTQKKLKTDIVQGSLAGDKSIATVRGNTALHIAAVLNRSFIASLFIITGNLDALWMKNKYGNTPLLEALLWGHWDTVFMLLKGPLEGEKEQEYRESFAHALNARNKAGISAFDALLMTTANIIKQKDLSTQEQDNLIEKVLRILDVFIARNLDLTIKMGPDFTMTHLEYCEQHKLIKISQLLKISDGTYFHPAYDRIKNHIRRSRNEFVERIINGSAMSDEEWIEYLQPTSRTSRLPRSLVCNFQTVL